MNKKILELGCKIYYPQNDAIVDELCEESAFVQERKDNLDDLPCIQRTQIRDKKRLGPAQDVHFFYTCSHLSALKTVH